VEGLVRFGVEVVVVGVGRKCDASFCNLDFALLMVERILKITKKGKGFEASRVRLNYLVCRR
jgi:hypothetical protein